MKERQQQPSLIPLNVLS